MFTKRSYLLTIKILVLVILGIVMITSSSTVWAELKYDDSMFYFKRQAMFSVVGFIAMVLTSKIDLLVIEKHHKKILFFCYLSLIAVLIPGLGVARNGSRSWFGVGSFLFQPSEFFKLGAILSVSSILANGNKIKKFKDFAKILMIPLAAFGLILLQPDFGSGIVMVCSIVMIIYAANTPIKYFVYLVMTGILAISGLILAAPYRLQRILSFLDPWADPLGSGFQIIQSYYAIAPGGLLGLGFNNSIQKHFYLPEPQTDFIFSICAEELGFIGACLILMVYFMIIYDLIKIAKSCNNMFLSYVVIGILSLFCIQVLINLGVVVGIFPVTGITLPFLSYGGSSLVMMMASFGFVIGINNQR